MANERSHLIWDRQWPASAVNFDLLLSNSDAFNQERAAFLLDNASSISHRGVTLNRGAANELSRWFQEPTSPLRSHAYVGLSNWFLTAGGDASSDLARRCETLWDYLFAVRPPRRLSSAEKGRNHKVLLEPFELFWSKLFEEQGTVSVLRPFDSPSSRADDPMPNPDRLKTKIEIGAIKCEAEGCPEAVAELIRLLARWNISHDLQSDQQTQEEAV